MEQEPNGTLPRFARVSENGIMTFGAANGPRPIAKDQGSVGRMVIERREAK